VPLDTALRKQQKKEAYARYAKTDKWHTVFRRHYLKKEFGITIEQYDVMFESSNGCCYICGKPETAKKPNGQPRRIAVDHDHATGQVRGLLCTNCNHVIGHAKDNVEVLRAAINYLEGSFITTGAAA
jgi:hypothetical protein